MQIDELLDGESTAVFELTNRKNLTGARPDLRSPAGAAAGDED